MANDNSDEAILELLDLISRQSRRIAELTRLVEQATELATQAADVLPVVPPLHSFFSPGKWVN
jgi:hypothetical protein